MSKKLFTSCIVISLLLGLAATSFAGMGIPNNSPNIGTEAGLNNIVPSPKALAAAASYDYNSRDLVTMGTEAGSAVIASGKAKTAAENFDYNAELLSLVGTEAGQTPSGVGFNNAAGTGIDLEYIAGEEKSDTNVPCRC